MFSPAVISSKKARQDADTIKANHSTLLQGMARHRVKIDAYTQQKAIELQNENAVKTEMDKERMVADSTAQKDAMDFALRQAEIDIKRSSLSSE